MQFFQNKENWKLLVTGLMIIFGVSYCAYEKSEMSTEKFINQKVEERSEPQEQVDDCVRASSRDKFTGEPTMLEVCRVGQFMRVKMFRNGVLVLDYECQENPARSVCEPVMIHYATPDILERIEGGEGAKEKYKERVYREDM